MKKSKITIVIMAAIAVVSLTVGSFVYGKNLSLSEKKDLSNKLKTEFDDEHSKLLNSNVPVTEAEINRNAEEGDKLKEKGIESQELDKQVDAEEGSVTHTKDEVISQINLGISVIEQAMEDFIKTNPGKDKSQSLDINNEPNIKTVNSLNQLKEDLTNDKISAEDAWKKVIEIRDGKK
ncbi:MAG: hypothetical protein ABRQ27_14685 [Clostridiaceae bacterium]